MKITFLGHATLLLEIGDKTVLVDPFISGNPKNTNLVDKDTLNPDYILVTHAHQDHVLDVEDIAKRTDAVIVSNFEIATHYENKGLKVHPMNHGGSWTFDFGTVKYVNAIHTSSFADGSNGGLPGGFIVTTNEKSIYIAGDTALTMDMKLIPMFTTLDLAILPIGDNFTMGVDDAIIASNFVECTTVLGYHFDTFGFIEIDETKAVEKFKAAGKQLHLLPIGASLTV
ncbi:metal-dependent hydrolase [Cellulophaga sp. 20_2_10]|uniref:metal-dependent hydrolase n=1 Tax=Cellulophaga sp. 20_2_10 TaxID=2942476 RepID=UPI00201B2E4B|nr:metal-dependent hydrolase [Cellulophaga sp. 20_2_10]MCL5244707.1 metal-dependent hydrolase [Cellulophaga sp. 20_2_10]